MNNRNFPCFCGSGKKFKFCCWSKEHEFPKLETSEFKKVFKKISTYIKKRYERSKNAITNIGKCE